MRSGMIVVFYLIYVIDNYFCKDYI